VERKKIHENFRVKKTSFLGVMKIRPIKKEVTTPLKKLVGAHNL